MHTLEDITKAIMADPENQEFTKQGIKPLFAAHFDWSVCTEILSASKRKYQADRDSSALSRLSA